ncbi:MAG: AAA family ATPase [Pantoea sp.]|uniref:AAA family ATPase n=1 Tax=Pantoea sp. TaxID=69393 RepID=UPI0039E4F922
MVMPALSLADLGPRICILGPSNSGKSTLAHAIAQKTSLPLVHLDQLYHLPNTHWQARSEAEFLQLHQAAIAEPSWVMDGNYVRCLPDRLTRATGLILLEISTTRSVLRYFRRTLLDAQRVGGVVAAGQQERITWEMLRYLLLYTRSKQPRNREMFTSWQQPKLLLSSAAELQACYQAWELTR